MNSCIGLTLFAGLLGEPVSVAHYLVVGAILFVSGVACMAIKRKIGRAHV